MTDWKKTYVDGTVTDEEQDAARDWAAAQFEIEGAP